MFFRDCMKGHFFLLSKHILSFIMQPGGGHLTKSDDAKIYLDSKLKNYTFVTSMGAHLQFPF